MAQAQFRIVAQVAQILLSSLRNKGHAGLRRWARVLVLPLVLTFAGVVTAFGIAPNTVTDTLERTQVIENLVLSTAATLTTQAQQTYWREERIQRGDTLARLISRLQVNDAEALAFLNTSREARMVFQLVPGRSLRAETSADGKLLTLHYLNGERLLTVKRDGDNFFCRRQPGRA